MYVPLYQSSVVVTRIFQKRTNENLHDCYIHITHFINGWFRTKDIEKNAYLNNLLFTYVKIVLRDLRQNGFERTVFQGHTQELSLLK